MNIIHGEFVTAARRRPRDDKSPGDKSLATTVVTDAFRPRWADAIPLRIEDILQAGGDTRLDLDPTTLFNHYGCKLQPRDGAIAFSSSTASTISEQAYAAVGRAHRLLTQASYQVGSAIAANHAIERLRRDLKEELGLGNTGVAVVLSPSGTDSALHALAIARSLMAGPPVSVIAASEETGSGIPWAAAGCHPDRRTSLGASVVKGTPIEGLGEGVDCIPLPCRDTNGRPLDATRGDRLVRTVVGRIVDSRRPVLLYAMDQSKLGARMPSFECLETFASVHLGQPMVVVDACQGRLSRSRLRWYLDQGFMVQITGSKFFSGPAFSGALLVPTHLALRMREVARLPEGLRDYSSRCDWPADWEGVRNSLPEAPNLGLWLRWIAALEEMRTYHASPASFRHLALGRFAWVVSELIRRDPGLELLTDYAAGTAPRGAPGDAPEEMEHWSILPFFVRQGDRPMSMTDCVELYRALNTDVSATLPPDATAADLRLAATPCHIGQPVAVPVPGIGMAGALRISADVRLVSDAWAQGGEREAKAQLDRHFARAGLVLAKIGLLKRRFERPALVANAS